MDRALRVLGQHDRADAEEEYRKLRPRWGGVAEQQGRCDDEADGGEQGGDVRAHTERHEDRQPCQAEEGRVGRRHRRLLLRRVEASSDAGDERGQARDEQLHLQHAQSHRARGGLAPAHRVQREPGRGTSEVDGEDGEEREHREAEIEPRSIGGGEFRTDDHAADAVLGERVEREHESLHQQREGERHQRDVQVAEPDREETDEHSDRACDHPAHDDGEQDRDTPVVGEPRRADGADAGECDLAEPEHASLARDERERQEHDGERGRRTELAEPERFEDQADDADDREDEDGEEEVELDERLVDVDGCRELAPTVRRDGSVECAPDTLILVDASHPHEVDDDRDHDEDERDARDHRGGELAVGRQEVLHERARHSHEQRDDHRDRQTSEARGDDGRERGRGEQRELARVEADHRGGQDPRQPRQEHCDHPHTGRDPRWVAPRQRRHRFGVDHCPHAEAGFRVPQHDGAEHDDREQARVSDHLVEGHDGAEERVDVHRFGCKAGREEDLDLTEDDVADLRDRHEEPDRDDDLDELRRQAQEAEDPDIEQQTERRRDDEETQAGGREDPPALLDVDPVVGAGDEVGEGTESEVQHSGRHVRDDEPRCRERVDAPQHESDNDELQHVAVIPPYGPDARLY